MYDSGELTSSEVLQEYFRSFAQSLGIDLSISIRPPKRPTIHPSNDKMTKIVSPADEYRMEPFHRIFEDIVFREFARVKLNEFLSRW